MRMRRVVALAVIMLSAAAVRAQQPVFRSNVDLVRLDLLVVRDGEPVTGLTANDFEVVDNGVRQQIERISFEEVPIDVVLVFDTSLSVSGPKLYYLVEAGHALVAGLRSDDRVGLVTFDSRVRLRSSMTGGFESVERLLDQLQASGSTSLVDGLYWSLMLPLRAEARQVVLLFSDGLDNTSWLRAADVLQVVQQSDAVIYSVGLRRIVAPSTGAQIFHGPTVVGSTISEIDNRLLESLAEDSGGRLFFADSSERLRSVFERVLAEMRARYLLTYYPQGVTRAGWHSLQVRLKNRRGDVISRRGYFVRGR